MICFQDGEHHGLNKVIPLESWNFMGYFPAGMVFDANLEGEEVQELKMLHFWRPNCI